MDNGLRNEVLTGLVYRARTDSAFRSAARNSDPERLEQILVGEYRYELNSDELELCKNFARLAVEWSEQELDEQLAVLADPVEESPINPLGV